MKSNAHTFYKRYTKRIVLVFLAIVFSLSLVEIFLRFFMPVTYRVPSRSSQKSVWRGLVHKQSPIEGLAYELNPNIKKNSHGAMIEINSYGLRDSEPIVELTDSLSRIVAIGDSYTFGYGVAGNETYPNVLESILNKNHFGKNHYFDVLNFGVGGYSTRDEAIVLKHKALAWNPDLIILGYCLNDPEIDPVQWLTSHFHKAHWWQYSHLLRLLAFAKNKFDVMKYGGGDYYRYLHENERKWMSVVNAFDDIKEMATKQGVEVLLIIYPNIQPWEQYRSKDLHKKVAAVAKKNGFYVIDMLDIYMNYDPYSLCLSETDGHPNKFGHDLIARAIYDKLVAEPSLLLDKLNLKLSDSQAN